MTPLLSLDSIDCAHKDGEPALLSGISLSLHAGECHCISGATGAGKSTLLLLAAGLGGVLCQGQICVQSGVTRALVLQDPHTQLLRRTIGAEVAFSLENLGIEPSQMPVKVRRALQRVGLDLPFGTQVATLSLGQKYRLMIAAQLVSEPGVLMLDEPWAQLDDEGVRSLTALLMKLKAEGMALLLVEHHADAFAELIDHYWTLKAGRLTASEIATQAEPQPCFIPSTAFFQSPNAEVRLTSPGFTLQHSQGEALFESPALEVNAGELVLLCGTNGCGKSSLLSMLAGCGDATGLPVSVMGKTPELGTFGYNLCYLMQRPNRQLFEMTVEAELSYSLKRYGLPQERGARVMNSLQIAGLAQHSPHRLSYGQQHLIALASLVCLEPKVFLLDDPFAGLDSVHSQLVVNLLQQLRARGCTLIIATHRPMALAQSQTWHIRNQRLEVEYVGQT
ncbi:energy-coupling factor ABC transporter ATP-binding protein [Shewanella corallii]|uniref:Energy-coupling factor ABC transporter ATP-binding protein n=1 Tax=Shewanella corallii TaxID=560080 RepID=A0ABT0N9I4_9GAMM|nr:ABC transporter ATP-binding protein [Shewanella corallii]MCL2915113.1 energy-coupling factor ABC transporter ATP-binding protein [Shewanella corallii]